MLNATIVMFRNCVLADVLPNVIKNMAKARIDMVNVTNISSQSFQRFTSVFKRNVLILFIVILLVVNYVIIHEHANRAVDITNVMVTYLFEICIFSLGIP